MKGRENIFKYLMVIFVIVAVIMSLSGCEECSINYESPIIKEEPEWSAVADKEKNRKLK